MMFRRKSYLKRYVGQISCQRPERGRPVPLKGRQYISWELHACHPTCGQPTRLQPSSCFWKMSLPKKNDKGLGTSKANATVFIYQQHHHRPRQLGEAPARVEGKDLEAFSSVYGLGSSKCKGECKYDRV